jgi:hypothetical protein
MTKKKLNQSGNTVFYTEALPFTTPVQKMKAVHAGSFNQIVDATQV